MEVEEKYCDFFSQLIRGLSGLLISYIKIKNQNNNITTNNQLYFVKDFLSWGGKTYLHYSIHSKAIF